MRVFRSTRIDLPPATVWAKVQTAPLLQHIAWPMVRFIPVGETSLDAFQPGGRYRVKLRLFGFIPFGTQWIVTSLHEPENGEWPKRLRDNGYSALIAKWDHWITVAPDANGGTKYSDDVAISAGIWTPFIWAFAQTFYWHRQRRWRGLSRTLPMRRVIADEMTLFRAARVSREQAAAWRHLERAHIVSQPHLGLHLASHWSMLGFAVELRDWRETAGQIVRLALAPLGALTGRIPVGNTGRSNVSAFQTMPVPDDLQRAIETAPE
jgi:ligand-binding SRPBCC domain-containing protein